MCSRSILKAAAFDRSPERDPMVRQASGAQKHLRRFLTADPGRFAGGSAVSDPLGLLAVERERLAVPRSPQHDGSSQAAATADQGTQPIRPAG
jgi:hypothetical protein